MKGAVLGRLVWFLLGVAFCGAIWAYAEERILVRRNTPDPAVIEWLRERSYSKVDMGKRPEIEEIEEVPEELDLSPVVAAVARGAFLEPLPPVIMNVCPEPEEAPRAAPGLTFGKSLFARKAQPNWTLRPGDVTGTCSFSLMDAGNGDFYSRIKQTVSARTPSGVVSREIPAVTEAWIESRMKPPRRSVDLFLGGMLPDPAIVAGGQWRRPWKRIGGVVLGSYALNQSPDQRSWQVGGAVSIHLGGLSK